MKLTQRHQILQDELKSLQLQKEAEAIRLELAKEVNRIVSRTLQAQQRRGYKIRELAQMDGLSYGTVKSRVAEMQQDKKFSKYVRDYGGYRNGAYKQCLRIDLEGWIAYGNRK